ncbi:MAG: polysaccharide deacetylase family protein [Bacteroidetes bacterium]|nr:polysaccharide deacetylase family protein [Bacteroidota bacterium]MBS1739215.1 polysaccharide deacetylase family protein [Bacteroidota bacterium]
MNLHWLVNKGKGIPVLMYHRIWPNVQDRITQTPEQLLEQLYFLKRNGYRSLTLPEYIEIAKGNQQAPEKGVLITFDDGYYNNLTYVYPLLKELQFTATIFVIGDSLEGNLSLEDPLNRKMSVEELKTLDSKYFQLAMHGFHHENFSTTSLTDIQSALVKTFDIFQHHQIPLVRALAYPYGARPEEKRQFDTLKQWMRNHQIEAAFRIGNRVSTIPSPDLYEIKRIDIQGNDSIRSYAIKLQKGRLKPF